MAVALRMILEMADLYMQPVETKQAKWGCGVLFALKEIFQTNGLTVSVSGLGYNRQQDLKRMSLPQIRCTLC